MKIAKFLKGFLILVLTFSFWSLTSAVTHAAKESEEVKVVIEEYFSDTPHLFEMLEIARCESNFRQFSDSGTVFRGSGTVGIFQIHEVTHLGTALALGFDLETIVGNVAYSKYLYNLEGLSPWRFSGYCWEEAAKAKKAESLLTANSPITGIGEKVLALGTIDDKTTEKNIQDKDGKKTTVSGAFTELVIEKTDSKQIANLKLQINLLIKILELTEELNLLKAKNTLTETA